MHKHLSYSNSHRCAHRHSHVAFSHQYTPVSIEETFIRSIYSTDQPSDDFISYSAMMKSAESANSSPTRLDRQSRFAEFIAKEKNRLKFFRSNQENQSPVYTQKDLKGFYSIIDLSKSWWKFIDDSYWLRNSSSDGNILESRLSNLVLCILQTSNTLHHSSISILIMDESTIQMR